MRVLHQVKARTDRMGPETVKFAWVEAHIGLPGDKHADQLAKEGATKMPEKPVVTEGGLRQEWKRMRERERRVKGPGMGRVIGWDRKGLVNYTQCRTGKENLLRWKKILDPDLEDVSGRKCGGAEESGAHVALVCFENEGLQFETEIWQLESDRRTSTLAPHGAQGGPGGDH